MPARQPDILPAVRRVVLKRRNDRQAQQLLAAILIAQRKAVDIRLKPIIEAAAAGDKRALTRALKALDEAVGEPMAERILESASPLLEASYKGGTTDILSSRAWRLNQTDRKAIAWLKEDFVYWVGNHHGDALSRSLREVLAPAIEDGLSRTRAAKLLAETLGPQLQRSRAYWEGLANHVTTRARTFGATEGLVRAGATNYRINAVMDHRTSTVCRHMHGKVFTVAQAVRLRDKLLAAETPEDVKTISPWLRETQVVKLSPTSLARRGFCLPPFHFNCRTTVEIWVVEKAAPPRRWFARRAA